MTFETLADVYHEQLSDLMSVERQLRPALERLAKGAMSTELKEAFTNHREETAEQLRRLMTIFERAEVKPRRHKCEGIAGIIKESRETLSAEGDGAAKDAAIIAAAQRAEHYEIAGYGTVVALAKLLGKTEDVELLQQTLDEEKQADERLSQLAIGQVNPEAHQAEGEADESSQSGASATREPRADVLKDGSTGALPVGSVGTRNQDKGMATMDRDDYRNGGDSRGGRGSNRMPARDEYGQFESRSGGREGGYRDDRENDRGSDSRDDHRSGSSSGYQNRSSDGQFRGGSRSSSMQGRDEYGQFQGGRGDSGSSRDQNGHSDRYDDRDDRDRSYGSDRSDDYENRGGGSYGQRGRSSSSNDDYDDRNDRSNQGSSRSQDRERDSHGQFMSSDNDDRDDSRGGSSQSSRSSSRNDDDDSDSDSDGRSGGRSGGSNSGNRGSSSRSGGGRSGSSQSGGRESGSQGSRSGGSRSGGSQSGGSHSGSSSSGGSHSSSRGDSGSSRRSSGSQSGSRSGSSDSRSSSSSRGGSRGGSRSGSHSSR